MSPNMTPVSIIIPTRDNVAMLSVVLDRLIGTLPDGSEVLVVANGTPAEVQATVGFVAGRKKGYPYNLVPLQTTAAGFSPACNLGLKYAKGHFLVLLNDDTIPSTVWFKRVLDAFQASQEAYPEIKWGYAGVASNKIMPSQQLNPNIFKHCNNPDAVEVTQAQLDGTPQVPVAFPLGVASGMCLVMTRDCYQATGPLHEFGLGGFEDNDWCLRAQEQGFLGLLAARAFVFHHGHVTLNRFAPGHKGGVEHQVAFMKKWYKPRQKTLCVNYRVKIDTPRDLEYFLLSLKRARDLADWVVIFDDRSTIDLLVALEQAGLSSIVKAYERNQHPDRNEVRDRNRTLELARATNPDWIWNLDHDEVPHPTVTREVVQRLMNPPWPQTKLYTMPIYTFWRGCDAIRADGTFGKMRLPTFFKNDRCFGDIHAMGESEFHCRRAPTNIPVDMFKATIAIRLLHYGYESFDRVKAKREYYLREDKVRDERLIGSKDYQHLVDESALSLVPVAYDTPLPTLTVGMLARTEAFDVVRQIMHWSGYAENMLVVDTGSLDDTVATCEYFNIPVVKYRCCEEAEDPAHMLCDFSAARNFTIEQVKTDYLLFLDPDEVVDDKAVLQLDKQLLERADGYFFSVNNYNRVGGGVESCYVTHQPRLFKIRPELRYASKVHETLEEALRTHPELDVVQTDMVIHHYGFLKTSPEARVARNARYAEKLEEVLTEHPDDYRAMFALAVHLNEVGDYARGDAMLAKVVELNPKYFPARWELALRLARSTLDTILAAGSVDEKDRRVIAARQLAEDLIKWFPDHPAARG